jgi:class 3 adenylate cyclase
LLHYAATTLRTSRDVLLCSAGVMAYTAGGLQLFPKRGVAMVLFAVFLAAFSFWATTDIQAGIIWSTIYSSFVGFCLAIHMMMDFRLKREARREFRFRSQVAPAHIVRRCTSETEDLAAMFRAEQKYCVCISTDWRNYQELSASLSPQELSGILNAYYDLAHELLERSFPEGNFFTDWVADELFVVVFETAAGEGGRLVDVAMTFASDLLAAKDRFYRRHGLPRAVDVGIAAGDAVLGLLGPNGLRKATAVGQTPGRARRLQSAGKLLRRSYGEGDRIIFGRECLMQLKGSLDVVEVELAEGQSIRDLKDRELYFVQPFPNFPNKDAAGNPEAESA